MDTSRIPGEFRDVFVAIDNQVVMLHATWSVYRRMFDSEESVNLINRLSPFAGRVLQEALLDSVILQVTRVTDRAGTKNFRNLSFERLLELTPASLLKERAAASLQVIKDRSQSLRAHRDKRISHSDLEHVIAADMVLPPFSLESIEVVLTGIREFMNLFHMHYRGSKMHYEDPVVRGGGNATAGVFKLAARLLDLQDRAWRPDADPNEIFEEVRRRRLD